MAATARGDFDFEKDTTNSIETGSALLAYPFSVDLVFTPESHTTQGCVWSMADNAGATNYHQLVITTGALARYACSDAGGNVNASSTNTFTDGVRAHICLVATSATDRRVILAGDWANSGTNATSRTPAGLDNTVIGRVTTNSPGNYADGVISQVAMWSVALTQSDVESLAANAHPYQIQRGALVCYMPTISGSTTPFDACGNVQFGTGTAPTWVAGSGSTRGNAGR